MSAQQRYLTLVQHISKIYSADDGGINELTNGLKDILTRINPAATADWKKVQSDSKRLLRVWHSRADDDDAAADEVVDQIAESLKEFSNGEIQLVPTADVLEAPTLVVSEVAASAPVAAEEDEEAPVVVVVKKAVDHGGDTKLLIEALEETDVEEEEEEVEVDEMAMEIENTVAVAVAVAGGGSVPMEEDDEEQAEFEELEEAIEDAEEEEEEEEEEVIEPEEEEEEEEEKPVVAKSKAVVEEEEEEEEEEGLEVEKRVIRGRPYWMDVNTNKLYAIVGDDDVGDEVGAIVNGKPVFRC